MGGQHNKVLLTVSSPVPHSTEYGKTLTPRWFPNSRYKTSDRQPTPSEPTTWHYDGDRRRQTKRRQKTKALTLETRELEELSLLLSVQLPQSSSGLFWSLMVRAEYICVSIIHRTLTWTTGSLPCAQMLMHAIAHGDGVRTPKRESALKVDSGKKILCRTGASNLRQRRDGPTL